MANETVAAPIAERPIDAISNHDEASRHEAVSGGQSAAAD